ncbi:MAG: bifunctional methylenetetrahydrofolate dehydrogenase/methenyltetrahydrofolate cyclohydrolase FolD [Myxococcales bacterium]|nr:bifunctional methylenetetrahydrofolate dehydrogenase/methenyltetrahydrofolate cyclohydrolase FolD [Myxococcales bacterium]
MSAMILDGKALAAELRAEVAVSSKELAERGVTPGLAVVLIGDDPASKIYVRHKERAAQQCGISALDYRRPADVSQEELLTLVLELNADSSVHGILVQLPLPDALDATPILDAIDPAKDVDGFHPDNIGRLAQGRPRFVAATPKGCMSLLAKANVEIAGKNAVVVGRSNIVGKPMAMLLTNANATVTLCHSRTTDLAAEVKRADIVVAAVGKVDAVRAEWLKPGAVVIDVGMNRNADGKLCGDVQYEKSLAIASAITPVPGGVGPMTIASLMQNVVTAASKALAQQEPG